MRAEAKAAIVCLVGALAWFAPWLAPGKALLGTHPALMRPYDEATPPAVVVEAKAAAHPLYTDKLLQHDPEVRFTARSLHAGRGLPTWNPLVLGGIPHLATGLSSALYPLMAISWLVEPPRCYAVIAALQTALAGWFAFLMLRAFHVRAAAAGCGALLFAGSGWMSAHQEYFQLTAAATWLPLALAGTKRLLDRRGGALALGIAVGCAFLSGFPQIAFFSLLVPGLLFVGTIMVRLRRRSEPPREVARHALRLAVPALLGLLIAAPQLLATAELVPWSTRQPLTADILEQHALPPAALAAMVLPDVMARSHTQADLDAENAAARAEQRPPRFETLFGMALIGDPGQRNNRFEIASALGPAALLFALLGLVGGRKGARLFFAALLLLGVALVLPGPLLRASVHVPGLDIGDPKRALLLIELALAALAALGIERVLDDVVARRRALAGFAAAAVGLCVVAAWAASMDAETLRDWAAPRVAASLGVETRAVVGALTPAWLDESGRLLVRELLIAASFTALALVALAWRHGQPGRAALGGLLVALAVPLAAFWHDTTAPIPLDGLDAKPALLRQFEGAPPAGRILRLGSRFEFPPWPPKLPMNLACAGSAGVRDAQGYVAVYLQRWRDLFEAVAPGSTESVAVRPLAPPSLLAKPLFDLLDVEYAFASLPIEAAPPEIDGWELTPLEPSSPSPPPDGATTRIALWRNREAVGRARIVRTVHVVASPDAVVEQLVSDRFAPATEAWLTIDDAESLLAGDSWVAVAAAPDAPRTFVFTESGPPIETRVDLLSESEDDLRFAVDGGGGLLVQTDCWYPGWSVRVAGREAPLLRVDHALRGVVVPPGERVLVQFHYTPRRLILGFFLVPIALGGLLLASVLIGRRTASA